MQLKFQRSERDRVVKLFLVYFWLNVEIRGQDECWPWLSSRDLGGYGMFGYKGRAHKAHRIAYTLMRGDIPKGLHVLHKCDRPECCNPAHLYTGTNKENHHDKCRKGRLGVVGGRPKLTMAQAVAIRADYATGGVTQAELAARYQAELAARYHVHYRTIQRIIGGHCWNSQQNQPGKV